MNRSQCRLSQKLSIAGLVVSLAVTAIGCRQRPSAVTQSEALLVVGIGTDVDNWYLDRFPDGDARFVWSQVYETLVRWDPDLNIQPGLATSWEHSDQGRVWTFHLRENVQFHDGSPLTAEAVVFSYGPQSYAARTVLKPVTKVIAQDKHTVKFVLSRPMPLPYYLTHVGWPIMAPSCVDEEGQFTQPIGSGPFRFASQTKDQEVVLVRHRSYWGQPPQLERVVFKVIPDATARVMALEAGDVDMIVKVPEAQVPRLERSADVVIHRKLSTFTDFIQFNTQRPPFSDLRLRQAVACAVDTQQLTATVLENVGRPAQGHPYSPVMLYYCPDLKLPGYDPGQARVLLAKAGWHDTDGDGIVEKDGQALEPTLIVTTNPNVGAGSRFVAMAEAIQGQLEAVGIGVNIQILESGAFLSAERGGNFDMLLRTGFFVWGSYPRHFLIHHSDNLYSHIQDAQLDELITQADVTVDSQKQRRLYHNLQQMTVDLLPAFYLVHQEKVVATRAAVHGYDISAEAPWLNLRGVTVMHSR